MRAFILAGGKGSRLRPFTTVIPKPLVPVGDVSILEILIRQLRGRGFDRITISVGYLAGLIQSYCGDGARWGVDIDYVTEDQPLGTAGALSLMTDLNQDRVLVTNGDILSDLDFGEVMKAHDPSHGATICANNRSVSIDFGVLRKTKHGHLEAYDEKPTLLYQVSMGVNVISEWVLRQYIQPGERLDMPDLMRALVADGHVVRILETDAYWLDMGRMEDLERATEAFAENPGRFLP